jgi:hypothetical protein
MINVTPARVEKMLGRKRMALVGQIWSEGNGIMVVLKPGLINTAYDTDGRFCPFEDTLAEFREDLLEFFDDIEKEG